MSLDFTHILSENSQLRADTTKLTRTPGRTVNFDLELVKRSKTRYNSRLSRSAHQQAEYEKISREFSPLRICTYTGSLHPHAILTAITTPILLCHPQILPLSQTAHAQSPRGVVKSLGGDKLRMPGQKRGCDKDEILCVCSHRRAVIRKNEDADRPRTKVSYRLMSFFAGIRD